MQGSLICLLDGRTMRARGRGSVRTRERPNRRAMNRVGVKKRTDYAGPRELRAIQGKRADGPRLQTCIDRAFVISVLKSKRVSAPVLQGLLMSTYLTDKYHNYAGDCVSAGTITSHKLSHAQVDFWARRTHPAGSFATTAAIATRAPERLVHCGPATDAWRP
jgi:hypothetical protein